MHVRTKIKTLGTQWIKLWFPKIVGQAVLLLLLAIASSQQF